MARAVVEAVEVESVVTQAAVERDLSRCVGLEHLEQIRAVAADQVGDLAHVGDVDVVGEEDAHRRLDRFLVASRGGRRRVRRAPVDEHVAGLQEEGDVLGIGREGEDCGSGDDVGAAAAPAEVRVARVAAAVDGVIAGALRRSVVAAVAEDGRRRRRRRSVVAPPPPCRVSSPTPPSMRSAPSPPLIVSLPASPKSFARPAVHFECVGPSILSLPSPAVDLDRRDSRRRPAEVDRVVARRPRR